MRFFIKYGILLFCTFSSIRPVTNCYKVTLVGYGYSEFIYPNCIATSLFIYNLFHIFLFNRHIREYMDRGKIVRNDIFHITWVASFLLYYVNYININILISTLYFAQTLDSGNPDEISQYILFYIVCAISVIIYDSLVLRMLLIFLMRTFCFYLQSHCIFFYLLNFLISALTLLSPYCGIINNDCIYFLTYIISAFFHCMVYLASQELWIELLRGRKQEAHLLKTNSMPHMMLHADYCVIKYNLKYLRIIEDYSKPESKIRGLLPESKIRDLLIRQTLSQIGELDNLSLDNYLAKITNCKQWLLDLKNRNDSKNNQALINDFDAIIKMYDKYTQDKDNNQLSVAVSLCEKFKTKFNENLALINRADCSRSTNLLLESSHLPTKIDISCELPQSHYDTYIKMAKYLEEDLESLEEAIKNDQYSRASIFNKLCKALKKAN